MRGESDVKKILDELHSNRISIDNDRKAYDKVRNEVLEVDGSILKSVEQWNVYCQKFTELMKSIFDRTSDINLFNLKKKVLNKNSKKLEKNIESCKRELITLRQVLAKIVSQLSRGNTEFSTQWNSGISGRVFRRNKQADEISELNNYKKNLEYEMDNFLLMQRSVEYAEAEQRDIIKKLQKHKEDAESKDSSIRDKLEAAVKELSDLDKKREELKSTDLWAQEFKRISEGIETTRKSILFLENRVSETQRMLEHQRLEVSAPSADFVQRPREQVENHVCPTSDKYQPPFKIRALDHFTIMPTSDVNTNTPSNVQFQTSEYSFNGKTKAPRMFQFKKKPLPSSGNTSESLSNRSQRADEGPNSSFQSAAVILLNSNNEGK